MARRIGISPSRLHALSRSEWGLSPQAWLAERRIGHVRKWLAESDLPIADLALRAGYADQSALTRAMQAPNQPDARRLPEANAIGTKKQESGTRLPGPARDIVRSGMRTRRPFPPSAIPIAQGADMSALNVTIDPSIKGAWAESASRLLHLHGGRTRPRRLSLDLPRKRELPRTSKPCWRPRRWPRIPNLAESRKAYKAFGKDPGRFPRFVRIAVPPGAPGQGPLPNQQRRGRQQPCLARNRVSPSALPIRPASVRTWFSVWARPGRCIRASARTTSRSKTCPCSQTGKARSEAPPATLPAPSITQETRSCLTVVFSFSAKSKLEEALALTVKRFGQYANPSHAESFIIE